MRVRACCGACKQSSPATQQSAGARLRLNGQWGTRKVAGHTHVLLARLHPQLAARTRTKHARWVVAGSVVVCAVNSMQLHNQHAGSLAGLEAHGACCVGEGAGVGPSARADDAKE